MTRILSLLLLLISPACFANFLLIPMDNTQTNHLKAYGLSYILLKGDIDVDWLLNYRGGSFMVQYSRSIEKECKLRAISYEIISDATSQQITSQISSPNVNMDVVKLHKAAKIAVYSPIKISPSEFENTDAVLLVLKYAEIPFEVIYDEEILKGDLPNMTGCICIMRILPVSMEETCGERQKRILKRRRQLPAVLVMQKFLK